MKVLIAGGGTGGHVYPAVTMAKAFQKLDPSTEVHFVGTSRGIEGQIVPKEGFPLHIVNVGRLNKNIDWSERFWTLVTLPLSLISAAFLVWRLKPDIVLGVGGYASAPALLMASLMGRFTAIWEPNAVPGLANRWLSGFVKLAVVVFDAAKPHLKSSDIVQMPMPVRSEMENVAVRMPQRAEFCVLVFGGSQGSRAINQAVLGAVQQGGDWLRQVLIVHQTGSLDFEQISAAYRDCQNAFGRVECLEYLHDMERRYQWADLVICRAGTGTISELAALGKAAILVPLPSAADDHQTKNAEVLSAAEAAILLPQSELGSESLSKLIEDFKQHPEKVMRLEENIKKFHRPQSAEAVVRLLMERFGQK